MLLLGGVASAQPTTHPKPLPAQWSAPPGPIPLLSSGLTAGEGGGVQQTGMQKSVSSPPEDTTAGQYAEILVLPGPDRVFGVLESEESFKLRMINKAKATKQGQPLEFPATPVLSKGRFAGRTWPESHTTVEADYVCHKRLYFEQKNFERYGWDLGPVTPLVSAGTFFTDVAFYPYNWGTDLFRNYECSAGYCKPGDPVPLLLYPVELSATGFLAEAAAVGGLIAIFP